MSSLAIVPSLHASPASPASSKRMVVADDPATVQILFQEMLERSGLSMAEVARRMGQRSQALEQYKYGYKSNPGLRFTAKAVEACGGRLIIEFPSHPLA